jgi:hypothetical protein
VALREVGAPVASGARTATGQSAVINAAARGNFVNILLNVTAVSGTAPSLALSIEWTPDGGTTWYKGDPADVMTAVTATGAFVKQFTVKAPAYRYVWTITGTTPSFTFTVSDFFS